MKQERERIGKQFTRFARAAPNMFERCSNDFIITLAAARLVRGNLFERDGSTLKAINKATLQFRLDHVQDVAVTNRWFQRRLTYRLANQDLILIEAEEIKADIQAYDRGDITLRTLLTGME